MAQTSVAQFASELKVPPSVLLEQLRAEESRRQQQLAELQAAELREKQERERKEAEQKAAEAAAAAAAAAAPAPATTLHAPKPAADAKVEKKPKKAKPTTVLRDDSARRRTIKTRGDAGGGVAGWHARGGRHRPAAGSEQATFAPPSEPLVREVAVAETITL